MSEETNQQEKITILALCYNQTNYVIETLDSIRNQSYPNIELIILDDHSNDNSVEIIENYIVKYNLRCKFIKHNTNKGICASLNEVLFQVNTKYFHLIACDDILNKDSITKNVDILESSDNETAIVYSDAEIIDEKGSLYQNRFIAYHKKYLNAPTGYIFKELVESNFIPAMTVTFKSEQLKNIGGWDESLFFEDYDMWLRLSRKYKFVFSDYPNAKYRLHDTNFHKIIDTWAINKYYIFFKQRDDENSYLKMREILSKFYFNKNPRRKEIVLHFFKYYKANSTFLKFIKYDISPKLFNFYKAVLDIFS